jgi:hypothetical protein
MMDNSVRSLSANELVCHNIQGGKWKRTSRMSKSRRVVKKLWKILILDDYTLHIKLSKNYDDMGKCPRQNVKQNTKS